VSYFPKLDRERSCFLTVCSDWKKAEVMKAKRSFCLTSIHIRYSLAKENAKKLQSIASTIIMMHPIIHVRIQWLRE